MHKTLSLVCGSLNAIFVAFHLLLATWIQHMPVAEATRALLHAFNIGGVLMIGFLTFAFLFCRNELGTKLGRGAVVLGALVYLTRAAAELAFFPRPSPVIIGVCVVAGLLPLPLLRPTRCAACTTA